MNLKQIKKAVDLGIPVHWATTAYDVVKDAYGQYFIVCNLNDSAIGLTWRDGKTLNGDEKDFFMGAIPCRKDVFSFLERNGFIKRENGYMTFVSKQ